MPRPFHSERLIRLAAHWVHKIATPVAAEAGVGEQQDAAGEHDDEGEHQVAVPDKGEAEIESESESSTSTGAASGTGVSAGSRMTDGAEDGAEDEDEDAKEDEDAGLQDRPEPPPGGLADAMGTVLRSKGFVWMDTLKDFNVFWSQSGKLLQVRIGGPWWASLPDDKWPKEEDKRAELKLGWDRRWGDRRCELVMIGKDMDKAKVREALEWCLCTEDEMKGGFRALTSHRDTLMSSVDREELAMQVAGWPADGEEEEEEEEEDEDEDGEPQAEGTVPMVGDGE